MLTLICLAITIICIPVIDCGQISNNLSDLIKDHGTHRVYGGKIVIGKLYPYMVSVKYKRYGYNHFCGGAILSPSIIITAAHCFRKFSVTTDVFYVLPNYRNSIYPESDDKLYKVKQIVLHDNPPGDYPNDLALLQLEEPIPLINGLHAVNLPKQEISPGSNLAILGYGSTERYRDSVKLRAARISIYNDSVCSKRLSKYQKSLMICGGTNDGQDACKGDSGGPLVEDSSDSRDHVLVGIVSWGPQVCGFFGGVYTNIYHYLNWIKENINKLNS